MFNFFKRKAPPAPKPASEPSAPPETRHEAPPAAPERVLEREPDTVETPSVSRLAPAADIATRTAPAASEVAAAAVVPSATPSTAPSAPASAEPSDPQSWAAPVPAAPATPVAPVAPAVPTVRPSSQDEAVAPAPAPAPLAATISTPVATSDPVPEPAKKASWLSRLKQGLSRTGQSIGALFVDVPVDENLFEELESALIMADAGVEATSKLITALRAQVLKERIQTAAGVKRALKKILADHLRPLERPFDLTRAKPLVVMITGVNGAGKTTSIGKLANAFQQQGASVLLAAGDTFRAAAREQLIEWGRRNNVSVISQDGGDPAAVAFDAVNAGRARGAGVVMIDTAGRLPTQLHLMEELKKIRRVVGKADGEAPHEVLLVVDGNTGQNAIAQIRAFDAAINLTGLVVTKLDGTAKGGTLAAVAAGSQGVRPVPVYWIGVGEGLNDLQPFVADEFAQALLGD